MVSDCHVIELEEKLSSLFARKYVVLTGRATTALYVGLKSLRLNDKPIILPSMLCPDPLYAVLYNNLKPIFCDVNLSDYNMSVDSLSEMISSKTGAIIPVHLFGQPADIDKIIELAENLHVYVIEDAAQALGGKYKGRKTGSMGNLSILSFSKILNTSRGGAILTDDKKIAETCKKIMKAVPEYSDFDEEMYDCYKRIFYASQDLLGITGEAKSIFDLMPHVFKEMYIYKIREKWKEIVYDELDDLEKTVEKRNENAKKFQRRLRHPDIIHPRYKFDSVVYRYSILIKEEEQRRKIVKSLREHGLHVSTLYTPLHRLFSVGVEKSSKLKNADYIGDRILNFRVDPSVKDDYIKKVVEIVLGILHEWPSERKGKR
jgi:perosamine synthetase